LLSVIPGIVELPILLTQYGLNPGRTFQHWLASALKGFDTDSVRKLRETMAPPPDLRLMRHDGQAHEGDDRSFSARLAIIASDVSTRTKADFPRMARLYWSNSDDLNPAIFARASMSVPFFFQPLKVPSPIRDQELRDHWGDMTGYEGSLPKYIRFLDGGILSNFPIYAFHDYRYVPRAPTFGVKLGLDRQTPSGIRNIIGLTTAAFRSTQKVLDYDFIVNNPEYRQLICQIDTGEHDWLNFRLTEKAKLDLFARGVKTAAEFLVAFKDRWGDYKAYRLGQTETAKRLSTS
jgi:NTE family protein